ncbi:MAG TPA: hypothetical protein VF465_15255 [Flavobacterium sp.]|uniref:hypothetical protein n=1 Tax=Flavobacterium sp. TaxID=239 RepID=UPI002ED19A37
MDNIKKKYIIDNLKWPVYHFDYYGHYIILFLPLMMIFAGFSKIDKTDFDPMLIVAGIIFMGYIIYRIESERKFKKLIFKKDLSTREIGKLLEKNQWQVINEYDGTIQLRTGNSSSSWGETVTIVRITKEKILINTQPNGRAAFTFFKDVLNYNMVKKVLT